MALPNYRAKFARSQHHVKELLADIKAFGERKPYRVHERPNGHRTETYLEIKEPIPDYWSGIIGDAVHNARAALDHLMVAAIRHQAPGLASYKHGHFVVCDDPNKFSDEIRKKGRGLSSSAREEFRKLKPWRGGNDTIWNLHVLDIIDKHNDLIPIASASSRFNFTVQFDGFEFTRPGAPPGQERGVITPPPVNIPLRRAERLYPLTDGQVISSRQEANKGAAIVAVNFKFEICFPENQISGAPAVVETVNDFQSEVGRIIDVIEQEILNKPAPP